MRALNIVYLHSHDTGRWVQPYGHAVPTPNLQRLAEEGMLFRNAHCAAPTCSPSRACLLTGQAAHRSGMLGLAHRGFVLRDPTQHLCHTLQREGYLTAIAGLQHVAHRPFADVASLGYERMLNHVNGQEDRHNVHRAAADFLASRPQEPFFLDVGFFETHRLGQGGSFVEQGRRLGDGRYARGPAHLPDSQAVRRDMADFLASAAILDDRMGQVLGAIESAGLADRTLVICTTDHGIAFPGMKCNLTDQGTGVMLILRGPGGFTGGKVSDAMVWHLDLFPTICDLAGIARPQWLQGESLAPLAAGASEIHEAIFGEVTYHAAYEPMRSVRTRRWKYIRRYDDRRRVVLPNVDDSPSKSQWASSGWADRAMEMEELYDLEFDPQERRNLAGDAAHAAKLGEMRQRLEQWMKANDDPLLRGAVPAPANAIVTPPDDYSPGGGGSAGLAMQY